MAKRRAPDPLEVLRELAAFGDYPNTYEGSLDAYRDFREVFLGSERGKRVLNQIMSWGHTMRSTADEDAARMAILNGERNLSLRILATIEVEPQPRPATATRRTTKPVRGQDG